LCRAASKGDIDILGRMTKLGGDDLDQSMAFAAGSSHFDIIKLMISLGAKDYEYAIM
jgi:hypothetical protein